MASEVSRWLSKKESEATDDPTVASEWSSLDRLFSARLYHQLTLKLLEFCKHPELLKGRQLVELYEHFLKEFETRISPLSLMELVALIITQMENDEALAFLETIEPKLGGHKEARSLCFLSRAEVQLIHKKDVEGAKKTLDQVEGLLDSMDGVSTVHGRFYLLQSEMHCQLHETAEYYRTALKFLGCTDIRNLSHEEQRSHAEKLAVAALIGDGIYNFGELLAHPILLSLKRTSKEFLVDLLHAFNAGNIQGFQNARRHWETIKDLKDNSDALHVKIILLCLMEMTFKRPSFERQLSFKDITEATGLTSDEVEMYVMKAISKGLVRGRIDQVGEKVLMTWVQPRVLDRSQISNMVSRLDTWHKTIYSIGDLISTQAADILM